MKKLLVIIFLLAVHGVFLGQAFHFNDTSTTLFKTTDQSPAHWYLEIYNDTGVDTLLRWKVDLSSSIAGWDINFDTQDTYHPNLNDGDSADFTCFSGLAFPQKLIIGNVLNNVTGTGSVKFTIWDPTSPSHKQLIIYTFVITPGATQINVQYPVEDIRYANGSIFFPTELIESTYGLFDLDGALIRNGRVTRNRHDLNVNVSGIYILRVSHNGELFSRKIILN